MSSSLHRLSALWAGLPMVLTLACTGEIQSSPSDPSSAPGGVPGAAKGDRPMLDPERLPGTGEDLPTEGADRFEARMFSTSPGLRRLTREEYRRTVTDLTGANGQALTIPAEFIASHHSQIAGAQKLGNTDVERFVALAEQIASARAPALLEQAGCETSDAPCVRQWAEGFLKLAWRGSPADRARYTALLEDERAGASELERVETFLIAALSSPHFLYRTELGETAPDPSGAVALTDSEVATRLSYLVWQSAPDIALLEAAERGELKTPEGRSKQLERMLQDERAAHGMRAFISDWMGVFGDAIGAKDASVLEGTDEALADEARASFEATIDALLFHAPGSYLEVLSTDQVFVTPQLETILDVVASGEPERGLRSAKFGPERVGVLTHPHVLAAHTKESGASPFPIGAFIYESILCDTIPVLENIPEEVEGVDERDLTLRQRLEARTAGPTCAGCHVKIGPSGFAFLPFDPIGRYSATDALDRPYDTAGSVPVGEDTIIFEHVGELSKAISAHPAAARCVADRLFRWTYGRFEGPGDEAALNALRELSVEEQGASRALLEALVASEGFTRARHQPAE